MKKDRQRALLVAMLFNGIGLIFASYGHGAEAATGIGIAVSILILHLQLAEVKNRHPDTKEPE